MRIKPTWISLFISVALLCLRSALVRLVTFNLQRLCGAIVLFTTLAAAVPATATEFNEGKISVYVVANNGFSLEIDPVAFPSDVGIFDVAVDGRAIGIFADSKFTGVNSGALGPGNHTMSFTLDSTSPITSADLYFVVHGAGFSETNQIHIYVAAGFTDSFSVVLLNSATLPPPKVTFPPSGGGGNGSGNNANIEFQIIPNGVETTVYIQYGLDTNYGGQTAPQDAGSGFDPVTILWSLTGLHPNTEYHYRLVTTGEDGTQYSADAIFTTQGSVWGAKMEMMLASGTTQHDRFLIAFDGIAVYSQTDIVIDDAGTVVITGPGTAIQDISSITVVPDPYPPQPDQVTYGFNKYCSPNGASAYELAVKGPDGAPIPAYQSSVGWNLVKTSDGTEWEFATGAALQLYAIPRCSPPQSWFSPEQRRGHTDKDTSQPTPMTSIKGVIASKAGEVFIPPQILWGKLWLEGRAGRGSRRGFTQLGWNQYGFTTVRAYSPGVPGEGGPSSWKPLDDLIGHDRTLVTADGGIGIAQITGITALSKTPGWPSVTVPAILNHLYSLSNDTAYNISVGASILEDKRLGTYTNSTPSKTPIPVGTTGGIGSPTVGRAFIENWYNAIWGYNGFPDGTTASNSAAPVYPDNIWTNVELKGTKRWTFLSPNLSEYKVYVGKRAVGSPPRVRKFYTAVQAPTLGRDATRKVAHGDLDFDGTIDVALSKASWTRGSASDAVSIVARIGSSRRTVAIESVSAVVSGGALTQDLSIPVFVPKGSGVFQGTIGGHFIPATTPYTVNFTVTLSGLPSGTAQASGATYEFSVK